MISILHNDYELYVKSSPFNVNLAEKSFGKKTYQLVCIKFNNYAMHSALLLSDKLQGHKHDFMKHEFIYTQLQVSGEDPATMGQQLLSPVTSCTADPLPLRITQKN